MTRLSDRIPAALAEARAAVARALRWPHNLGIELCPLRLPSRPETQALAVFVHGLADAELVRLWALEPLQRLALLQPGRRPFSPGAIQDVLPTPRRRAVSRLSQAVGGVLAGHTALFFDGAGEALLVDTAGGFRHPAGVAVPVNPHKELFGPALLENVALIRQRLRDPALVARPQPLPRGRGTAALVYLEGRAAPAQIGRVRDWLQHRGGEEALRRGLAAGAGRLGLLPDLTTSPWPDKVAALLDAGYVAVLVDRIPHAHLAPVTAAALIYSPGDDLLRRPLGGLLRVLRLAMGALVLLAPATVVALLNYHQEMVPTALLLALAATRESAGVPLFLEVLGLEVLQEVIREATFRLPVTLQPGQAITAGTILVLLLVLAGLVGPLPGLVSAVVAFGTLGLSSYDLAYITRIWRFWLLAAAGVFGLYGMAVGLFLLSAYLFQARSFGVPFLGEAGLRFTAPGRAAARRPAAGGGSP